MRATSFVCLLFKIESIENDAVLSLNCEDAAGIVILIVPVARSDLNKYFLACKLLEELNVTQPTLSHHMKILCDSGIVASRKQGKWKHYSISDDGAKIARRELAKLTTVNCEE